jgi:hypothetical protein
LACACRTSAARGGGSTSVPSRATPCTLATSLSRSSAEGARHVRARSPNGLSGARRSAVHGPPRPRPDRQRGPQALRAPQDPHRDPGPLRTHAPPHLGDELSPLRLRLTLRHCRSRAAGPLDGWSSGTAKPDRSRSVAKHPRRSPHRAPRRKRSGLQRSGPHSGEAAGRKPSGVIVNNAKRCSPDGIRTHDLFLEREAP